MLQGLLAFAFGMPDFRKLATPLAEPAKQYAYVADLPAGLVRFIRAAELAGVLGLLLPVLMRIWPRLVVTAALGLGLAAGFQVSRGDAPCQPGARSVRGSHGLGSRQENFA